MIIKHKYRFLVLLILMIIGFFQHSCLKPDISPRMEIKVINAAGDAVRGAYVSLFENIDEWGMQKNPMQVWKETNDDGKVLFIGLSEIVYYFYITKDNLDNSDGYISIEEPLMKNKVVIIEVTIN